MIRITELLKYMESGETFSCKVVSYDHKRKSGGEVLEFPEAQLVQKEQTPQPSRPPTLVETQRQKLRSKKDPHHRRWYTRNIRELVNGQKTSVIKSIHPPLIIEFNGQTVVP